MSSSKTLLHSFLCAAAAVSCAACTPAQTASQMPHDECPAPWPSSDGTPPEMGTISITFKNQMSRAVGVRRVLLGLDDVPICWRTAPGKGSYLEDASLPVLTGPLLLGEHTLKVVVNADGLEASRADLKGYRFEIKSSHPIEVEAGKAIELMVIAYEKDHGLPDERPAIRYVQR